ncbi:hypothetical protein MYP_3758 [Sporocytophaga myxococcoides]|uniref:CMP/dCMP-type deaminase domain-containing protein n=1 Tax=Sporocytophaga myxococcoides TaxID=153721 RepID=A0A098LK11_9BACT|nr:nucleoside deaminase [Sporocytophaga myxococcoides]GAL86528.1 hypothetical protein MYP_3758 [Sporocytophaga myxococcoides]
MKKHEEYLQDAIDYAIDNVRLNDGKPFGALVVKHGEVIGVGMNDVLSTHDPTAHAEIQALRKASSKLNSEFLEGCVIYASGHPCPMCLAAIYIAGIRTVYYGSSLEQSALHGFGVSYLYSEIGKSNEQRRYPLQQLFLADAEKPFLIWKEVSNPSEFEP